MKKDVFKLRIKRILKYVKGRNRELTDEEQILKSIKEAHSEWLAKEEYFNYAIDPDLVDFAVYDIEASRRKYSYLLKKIKQEKNM